jgi:hypothetical protein
MSNKKTQINIERNKETSQLAGLVVDLRKKADQEIKEIKEVKKEVIVKINKEIAKAEKEMVRLEKKSKRIKPNLLKISEKSRIHWNFSLKKKNSWSKIYDKQIKKFQQAALLKFKTAKNLIVKVKIRKNKDKAFWHSPIVSFILVLIFIIVPIKLLTYFEFLDINKLENKILGSSQLAINNLFAATDSVSKMDFKSADSQFQSAGNNFIVAQEELNKISDTILSLAALSNNPKLKLAAESKNFLRAGTLASSLGRNLVLATDSLFSGNKQDFSVALDQFTTYGSLAVVDARNLNNELSKINPKNLPPQYQDKFISLSKQSSLLADNLDAFVSAGGEFKDVLGATQDKRYLLVFQNNSELRASGGFLGSYALVDIRNGKIINLEVPAGGSYDTEGGMNVRVVAPKPLWLVNPLWHFWDANWWADWPTTAKNLMWFYEKSDGPTVDGVISVTPTVIERLLEITGPIDLTKEYGLTIDSNNFWDTVQKTVEQKNLAKTNPEAVIGVPTSSVAIKTDLPIKQGLETNVDNKPKKIIGDLMAKIMEILPKKLNKDNLVNILALFETSLEEKQILFYFTDPKAQAEMAKRNWAGEIKDTDRDYLMVVDTNIAGQKSDRKMVEKIEHSSEVALDGSIINTVKITRTHTGVKNEAMTGVRNVDWLRVYVPKGSQLISAEGFAAPEAKYLTQVPDQSWQENDLVQKENDAPIDAVSGTKVYEESNKTVFANWLMVDPGQSGVVTIKYRLGFNFLDKAPVSNWLTRINNFLNPGQNILIPYSLMMQKQPGATPCEFTSQLILPKEWPIFWRYPENLIGVNGWQVSDTLNADKYWSILITKK